MIDDFIALMNFLFDYHLTVLYAGHVILQTLKI